MSLHHSEETHRNLVARLAPATGRELPEWLDCLEEGPSFLRFDDKVRWLRDEFGIAHGHATAIVHEFDLRKAARAFR